MVLGRSVCEEDWRESVMSPLKSVTLSVYLLPSRLALLVGSVLGDIFLSLVTPITVSVGMQFLSPFYFRLPETVGSFLGPRRLHDLALAAVVGRRYSASTGSRFLYGDRYFQTSSALIESFHSAIPVLAPADAILRAGWRWYRGLFEDSDEPFPRNEITVAHTHSSPWRALPSLRVVRALLLEPRFFSALRVPLIDFPSSPLGGNAARFAACTHAVKPRLLPVAKCSGRSLVVDAVLPLDEIALYEPLLMCLRLMRPQTGEQHLEKLHIVEPWQSALMRENAHELLEFSVVLQWPAC